MSRPAPSRKTGRFSGIYVKGPPPFLKNGGAPKSCHCEKAQRAWCEANRDLQSVYIYRLRLLGENQTTLLLYPSTSAHMLLVARETGVCAAVLPPSTSIHSRLQRPPMGCITTTIRTFNQCTYAACSGKKHRMLVVHGLLCVHLNLFECIAQPPAEAFTATISNYGREVARLRCGPWGETSFTCSSRRFVSAPLG